MTNWTTDRWAEASRLLDAVLDLPATQRTAYLMEHVADDALRADLEALMEAEQEAPDFLEAEAAAFAWPLLPDLPGELRAAEADAAKAAERVERTVLSGRRVGPYRLVRVLGQGGMGTVYLAERDDGQFRQQVALKLVRGGALARSEDALRRFRQERQILADLQHPGIAALVGGGLTEASPSEPHGLPYLALDYVDGLPITAYCDAHLLDVRARLRLFAEVCEAVRYAHQNLVVHRDLKPSNILVEEDADGVPRARLLDFGIAKLLDTAALDASMLTVPETRGGRYGVPLTPAYAAPEQLRGDAVTTSADVYALGILLSELLTGSRPEVSGADAADVSSTRLAALVTPETAAARGTTPDALRRTLRGDLTALIQTTLADEPSRRYPSADALLADVRAYLSGLPLSARPPRASYRLSKFVRRHRGAVAAGALALVALLAGLGAALWQADLARAERDRARAEADKSDAVTDFFVELLRAEDPRQARGDTVTVRQVLASGADRIDGELAAQPEVQAQLLLTMGALYRSLGDYDRADSLLTRSLAVQHTLAPEARRLAPAASELAQLHFERIQMAAADSFMQIAVAELEARGDATPTEQADAFGMLGEIRREQRDFEAANAYYARTIDLLQAAEAPDGERIATTLNNMALVHAGEGRFVAAAPLLDRAVETLRAAEGDDHPWIATMRYNLAHMLNQVGRYPEAEVIFAEIVEAERENIGPAHPRFASSLAGQALVSMNRARFDEADSLFAESIRILTEALGPEDRQTLFRRYQRAISLHQAGRFDDALAEIDVLLAITGRLYYSDPSRRSVGILTLRGDVLRALGRYDGAYHSYVAVRAGLDERRGEGHPSTARLTLFMALARLGAGAHDEAEALARRAYHLRRDSTGPGAHVTAVMRLGYATVLAELGRLPEAEAHRLAADSVFVEKEGAESFEHLEALQLGARIALEAGRAADAATLAEASLAALQRIRTDAHPQTAESHCLLAEALRAQGETAAARQHTDAARPVVALRGSVALRERCGAVLEAP